MDTNVQEVAARPSSSAVTSLDLLKSWHREYIEADSNGLNADSHLVRVVKSDELDDDHIESQVQQLMSTIAVLQGFCVKCRHLLGHWPDLSTGEWACAVGRSCHTNEIEAAARTGCRFCSFLLTRLKVTGLLDTFRKIEKRLWSLKTGETASLSIQNWGNVRSRSQLLWLNLPGKVADHCNSPGAMMIKFESHVLSPAANLWHESVDPFDLAKMWIRECSSLHNRCRNIKRHEPPTRLVSISNDTVKLVPTATLKSLPKYATLSYSWGREQFLMLTSENLGLFQIEIPFGDLPKTFRDAIHIARKLEISYVWIDALCIIQHQDDKSDWLKESGHMRSVYGDAYVNLAASSATNVHGGCFTKPTYYNGGFCARTTTTEYSRVQNFHYGAVYEESSTNTYLASRAWSLQEKLLSPRTIYFGEQGMFWECRSNIKSEFLPDGFPGKLGSHLVRPEDQSWNWFYIVWYYSKAELTLVSDRLPALSGIATRQHETTGDQYLAGMWREFLVYQLPWTLRHPEHRRIRADSGVPTWSWASVHGQALLWSYWNSGHKEMNEYIHVVEAWTTPSGPDPFGAVSGGELLIACSVLVCGRLDRSASVKHEPTDSEATDVLLETGVQPVPIVQDCVEDALILANDVYMLPVFSGPSGMATHRADSVDKGDAQYVPEYMVRGLVLQRCGDNKGHFRRMGAFDFRRNSFKDNDKLETQNDHHDEFLRVLKEVGESTAEAECVKILTDPATPEQRFVITIE